ncbi:MAG: hypothetical protein RDU76_10440 [Candidatus Edwardsbacteria bacterium]|nr:hypothetical protein [Candidatus Edwardsbacteria bacterium]
MRLGFFYRFLFEEKATKRTVAAPLPGSFNIRLPKCLDHETGHSQAKHSLRQLLPNSSADATRDPAFKWSGVSISPIKQSLCHLHQACSGSMDAGAQVLLSAQLGGQDFFGYFLGHKKVIGTTLQECFCTN